MFPYPQQGQVGFPLAVGRRSLPVGDSPKAYLTAKPDLITKKASDELSSEAFSFSLFILRIDTKEVRFFKNMSFHGAKNGTFA